MSGAADRPDGEVRALWVPECSNRVFKTRDEALAAPLRSFELRRSNRYGFFTNIQAEPIDFSIGYQVDQGVSPAFAVHLELVADAVERVSSRESSICEIGCGKGDFLRILSGRSFERISGFDQSYEGDDNRIEKAYFSEHHFPLSAELLVIRHALDYIVDPVSYLADLHRANGQDCDVIIEIPSFDWILSQGSFWDLTFERVNYFTEQSVEALFGNDLIGVDRMFNGQYLLVHARLSGRDEGTDRLETDACQAELQDLGHAQSSGMAEQIGDLDYWIWGAGSKGVMFLHHHLNWRPEHIPLGCVDINPMRQGRFTPSTGLRVMSPANFAARFSSNQPVVVLNRNYVDEVAQLIEELTGVAAEIVAL